MTNSKKSEIETSNGFGMESNIKEKIFTTEQGMKHLIHNVIYPTGQEQTYFPMLEFKKSNGSKLDEVQVIKMALERDINDEMKHVTTFYFLSPPGLGKTVLGGYLAGIYNAPYQIINCVSTFTDLDLLGSHILINQETIWQDGPLPSIIRAANNTGIGILIINELNALTLNAQIALNPLLDKQECVIITQNNNEAVKIGRNSHLLVLATMNPDVMGVNELQDSIRDRSNIVIYMDYPTIEKETQLFAKALMDVWMEGDAQGKVFPFPKFDLHVDQNSFDDKEQLKLLKYACKVSSVNGSTYFVFDRDEVNLSMCCRLKTKIIQIV